MKGKTLTVYLLICASVLLTAHIGSRAVTVMGENEPVERETCILIDPGHGGEDGGAVSCTGRSESTYNLEIALRLRDLLELLGYDTAMTRETDISVYTKGETLAQKKISDLKQRVKQINETPDALLLSIHQNHFSDSRYSGPQVFYPKTEGSRELAKQLQAALTASLDPGSRRMAKQSAGVYLMEHITCPGVLIECGFLSNGPEEVKLRSPDYQKKLCCVIAATVSQKLSNT